MFATLARAIILIPIIGLFSVSIPNPLFAAEKHWPIFSNSILEWTQNRATQPHDVNFTDKIEMDGKFKISVADSALEPQSNFYIPRVYLDVSSFFDLSDTPSPVTLNLVLPVDMTWGERSEIKLPLVQVQADIRTFQNADVTAVCKGSNQVMECQFEFQSFVSDQQKTKSFLALKYGAPFGILPERKEMVLESFLKSKKLSATLTPPGKMCSDLHCSQGEGHWKTLMTLPDGRTQNVDLDIELDQDGFYYGESGPIQGRIRDQQYIDQTLVASWMSGISIGNLELKFDSPDHFTGKWCNQGGECYPWVSLSRY